MDAQFADSQTDLQFIQDTYLPIWIEQFLVDRHVSNMTAGTMQFYRSKLQLFQKFCDSQAISKVEQITPQTVREYLLWADSTGHNPGGVHAMYRVVRTFLNWYTSETEPIGWKNPIKKVRAPRLEIEQLEPCDITAVEKILSTCHSRTFTDFRDKAILLTLLDTGMRAFELLALDLENFDPVSGSVLIKQGKGRKPRTVFVGKKTRKAIRGYLYKHLNNSQALFQNDDGDRLGYEGLRGMIIRRAARAGVKAPTVHSFRRFFALECLRNGMNIYTLQRLMGHADLQVLRRYLAQQTTDLERDHSAFGPVDHL